MRHNAFWIIALFVGSHLSIGGVVHDMDQADDYWTSGNIGPALCPWDCGQPPDGQVGIVDFLALLAEWGGIGTPCDIDGGGVGIVDILALLGHWGPCPTQMGCGDPSAGSCFEANGTPGCAQLECCETVCAAMPACCDVAWDTACKDMANALCGMCGDPGAGDCCVANPTPGCNDSLCCRDVCAFDPVCCTVVWDTVCANEAVAICGCP